MTEACGRGRGWRSVRATGARTLGIDPGLNVTGYAVIDDATRAVIDAGVIDANRDDALPVRLAGIAAELEQVLAEHGVARVAVEELYAHYRHPRTAILMAHARGVILAAVARHGLPVEQFSATHIKKALTGNGHAGKAQVQRAILATLNLSRLPEPADVADALAVALCAVSR